MIWSEAENSCVVVVVVFVVVLLWHESTGPGWMCANSGWVVGGVRTRMGGGSGFFYFV